MEAIRHKWAFVPPMLSEGSDVIRFSLLRVKADNVVGVAMTTRTLTIFGDYRRQV